MALSAFWKCTPLSGQMGPMRIIDGQCLSARFASGGGPPPSNVVAELLKKLMDAIKKSDAVRDVQKRMGKRLPTRDAKMEKELNRGLKSMDKKTDK